jgi:RNA polymerase sigma factor (sigma-70 family)
VVQRETDEKDIDLVRKAMVDHEAIAILYQLYRNRVFTFCKCFAPDRDTAEDLTETAFCRLVEHLPEIAHEEIPVLPWLLRVAANASRSQSHRLGVEHRYAQRTGVLNTATVARDDADCVPVDAVRAAVRRRSSFEQACLTLSCVDGLPSRRIAEILASTPRQVSNALAHARSCLREELAPIATVEDVSNNVRKDDHG